MSRPVVYVDMDGVLVDFDGYVRDFMTSEAREKFNGQYDQVPGIFRRMQPMPGAIEAYGWLHANCDTYVLSTSPWDSQDAASDKIAWIRRWLPVATKRVILTHCKHLLRGDVLIDDRATNGADRFVGELVQFGGTAPLTPRTSVVCRDWTAVIEYMSAAHGIGS